MNCPWKRKESNFLQTHGNSDDASNRTENWIFKIIKSLRHEIKIFQIDVEKFLTKLNEEKKIPTYTEMVVSKGVTCGVKYALGPMAFTVSKNLLISGLS